MNRLHTVLTALYSSKRGRIGAAGIVGMAVLVVGAATILSHASGFFASSELENGTVAGNAQVVSDTGASGGKAVQFNAPVSTGGGGGAGGGGTTPTPGCTGTANHVAGGADGTGTCWPGPNNTGVPSGTTLTTYTGPCVVTTATTIDAKTINCNPLEIQAKVTITRSKVNGQVYIDSDNAATSYNLNWSLIMSDSEVNVSQIIQEPAVFEGAMTLTRDNIHGGITSVQCGDKAAQCIIQDSWLHGQLMPQNVDWHLGGFHSIGGTNYNLTHNTVVCDTPVNNVGGGCSGDIVFIPNGIPISHGLVQHNLMGASTSLSYCLYGGDKQGMNATYMTFKDNIFQRGTNNKCGDYGPVAGTSASNTGNVWTNNTWSNGGAVAAEE
jgi:dihydroxyacetone kinase DhaKLM complex PTS-EIIA-like component DhaM